MACDRHDWLFDTICPKCRAEEAAAAAARVTEAVTEPAPPSEIAAESECPDIPLFLRRNSDNSLMDPTPFPALPLSERPTRVIMEKLREAHAMSDAELHTTISSNMPVADRQPYLLELRRRQDRQKSRERIAKMKAELDAKKQSEI